MESLTLTDNPLLIVLAGVLLIAALVIWLLGRRRRRIREERGSSSVTAEALASAFDDIYPSFGLVLRAYLESNSLDDLASESEKAEEALGELKRAALSKLLGVTSSESTFKGLGLGASGADQSGLEKAMVSIVRTIYASEAASTLPEPAIREVDRFLDSLTD